MEFDRDLVLPPWWRELTFYGWALLVVGVLSALCFVAGCAFGATLFMFPTKSGGLGPVVADVHESPLLFAILMILNFIASIAIWTMFFAWLKRRREPRKIGVQQK
ncbi:MAG: hypothetical protein JNN20_00780 [Betaproteobacteria bacterium]|nr:hypothetical protein [Betaproteobacteria bacterium]